MALRVALVTTQIEELPECAFLIGADDDTSGLEARIREHYEVVVWDHFYFETPGDTYYVTTCDLHVDGLDYLLRQ